MSDSFKTGPRQVPTVGRMKRLSAAAVGLAENYILLNARVLERRRFECLFRAGDPAHVVAALGPYRNEDGGFGQALEPDGRGPGSQPAAAQAAFTFLDEVGALGGELAGGVCDHLRAISAEDGGLPFVHPNIRDFPRAPWWQIPERYEGSLIPTGNIAGLLHRNKVEHSLLATMTEFCWRTIEALTQTSPYEAMACVKFLDHVPDRARAEAAATRLGGLVRGQRIVAIPGSSTSDEPYYPWDYAVAAESLARQWFSDVEFDASLDHLVESQKDDGSWPVRWPVWTPATAFEWGGWVTIEAIKTLVGHGRGM
jgi:hypothetical protein